MNARVVGGVLVDMDDTLYPEHDYFVSGLRAVAKFAALYGGPAPAVGEGLLAELALEGRDLLFDRLLARLGVDTPSAALLVRTYRTHEPQICPMPDVVPALASLRQLGVRVGMVTDGHPTVQRAKFAALGLAGLVETVVYTADLPDGCSKPSSVPFAVAAELLGLVPESCVYVADDRSKDFDGPRRLGMGTIRIARQMERRLEPAREFDAEAEADTVVEDFGGVLAALRPAIARLEVASLRDGTGGYLA